MKKPSYFACVLFLTFAVVNAFASDWPDWRGPLRDGISPEKNLPEKWSLAGDNLAWKRPYGGRSAPIVSFVSFAWGSASNGAYRILAFDKKTGEIQWVASPGGRPTDTVYSSPIVNVVNGLREFIIGGSDGGGHALKPQDGEWIWSY